MNFAQILQHSNRQILVLRTDIFWGIQFIVEFYESTAGMCFQSVSYHLVVLAVSWANTFVKAHMCLAECIPCFGYCASFAPYPM